MHPSRNGCSRSSPVPVSSLAERRRRAATDHAPHRLTSPDCPRRRSSSSIPGSARRRGPTRSSAGGRRWKRSSAPVGRSCSPVARRRRTSPRSWPRAWPVPWTSAVGSNWTSSPPSSPLPPRSWSPTPARRTWPPRSAGPWCRCSRRSCRLRGGLRTASRRCVLGDQRSAMPGHPRAGVSRARASVPDVGDRPGCAARGDPAAWVSRSDEGPAVARSRQLDDVVRPGRTRLRAAGDAGPRRRRPRPRPHLGLAGVGGRAHARATAQRADRRGGTPAGRGDRAGRALARSPPGP